jgi:DNA-binding NtrC family response regulator
MPPKLLIVDDEDDMRRLLRRILAPVCDVIEAADGLDALSALRREKPRLMLVDITMPEMDGLAVLEAAQRISPATAVVMLTGDADVATAVAALDAGARAYITKPFDPGYLREEIVRLLEPPAKAGDAPWQTRGEIEEG